jgi:hypothetical protein
MVVVQRRQAAAGGQLHRMEAAEMADAQNADPRVHQSRNPIMHRPACTSLPPGLHPPAPAVIFRQIF